jgi:hypothetical protein
VTRDSCDQRCSVTGNEVGCRANAALPIVSCLVERNACQVIVDLEPNGVKCPGHDVHSSASVGVCSISSATSSNTGALLDLASRLGEGGDLLAGHEAGG